MLLTIAVIFAHVIAIFAAGTWRHWKEYYPTGLYVIIGDMSYNMLFNERYLWRYHTLYDHRIADMVYALFVFQCAVMLFLRYYPKGVKSR